MTVAFRRVLIANRGEIALRVIRACRELGLETVAVYSDADAAAPHVRAADQAVRLGPAPAAASYLRIDRLIEAALASGAQAVHPGYGFLSERAVFAEACADAGLVFVGPSPVTLAGLGDKLAARRTARAASVPVVPGTLEPARFGSPAERAALLAAADDVGWPMLVKAAAGGGGRGMRRVDRAADLPDALAAAARESEAAFGDGAVYLERLIPAARHIEVQLLGDDQGRVVALGERDCSVQRRHQKLVEESPAPGLTRDERMQLGYLATRIAEAMGLRNAATCEFLREADGAIWFLEVNARLQVEHGVTELVSGLDLVHEQLRIAAGQPLSSQVLDAAARAATPDRHAIEVRLSAEDPGADFAPQPGRLTAWRTPAGPGVRLDGWVEAGTVVPADYDPLLAKLLVVAADRPTAVARLARALDEFEIGGLQTTLPFHRWLAAQPDFRTGGVDIDFVASRWDGPARRHEAAGFALLAGLDRAALEPRVPAMATAPPAPGAPPVEARSAFEPLDLAPGDDEPWTRAARREAVSTWPP
ncbi:MAG: acetyl/propionyl/methylcrotonyl-CoA carboxylase subunit alpha [Candidatus Limnocylindrales bacterium]